MILHTTIPQELIFGTHDQASTSKEKLIYYNNVPVVVEEINAQEVKVSRVMSTDPQHYLDNSISPGTILSTWKL